MINSTIDLLGRRIKDKISGVEGIATSVSFDLYGCEMVIINRGLDKDGKHHENSWYDVGRIEVLDGNVVMTNPWAAGTPAKGPELKPSPYCV